MHDFCFTFPYAALLILGGCIGFLIKGSVPSLAGGVGSGLLLSLAAYLQLKGYEKRRNSLFAILLQLTVAIVLTAVMGRRFLHTRAFVPPGLISLLSFAMGVFYAVKFFSNGGNKFRRD